MIKRSTDSIARQTDDKGISHAKQILAEQNA